MGFVHRRTSDADIYFVANTSNQKRRLDLTFRSRAPEVQVLDPKVGSIVAGAVTRRTTDSTSVTYELEPYGSRVFLFSNAAAPNVERPADPGVEIAVRGPWKLTLGDRVREIGRLFPWTENESDKYFSGVGRYETSVDVPRVDRNRVFLDFGDGTPLPEVELRNGMRTWYDPPIRESAVIYVNGQKAGSLWAPPYRIDITKFLQVGSNQIRVDVGNTALNYLAGRRLPDYRLLNLRYGERFQPQEMEKIRTEPSGIVGGVRVWVEKSAK